IVKPVVTYDLMRDYSASANPTGAWSYGWKSNFMGSFNLFTVHGASQENGGGLFDFWYRPGSSSVYHNAGNVTVVNNGGQGVFPPGIVWFGPGSDGAPDNFGIIRLTVPNGMDGDYQVDASVHSMLDGSLSGDSDFHVLRNGSELFGRQIAPSSGTNV